ncbi:MAG: sulfatase-like hydrolase/transferase [Aeoliella sp.]
MKQLCLLALLVLAAAPAAAEVPNIVLIIADDLGYADVGFNGCTDIPTPNIDRMAAEGVRCTNAYVTHPFCSPSRAGLLTGRYQQRFGHENNPTFLPNNDQVGLPADQVTIADVLSSAGYVSSMVGKWHQGAGEPFHPLNRGFTHMYGFLGGGHMYFPKQLTVTNPTVHRDQYRTKLLRDRERVEETEYLTDAFSREGAAFIDRYHRKPFFLYLSYNAPHTPLQATEKYLKRFEPIEDEKRQVYAAMVSAVDDGVGRVLDTLQKHALNENTLVIFLSDNGGPFRVNGSQNTPLRDGKGTVFEGGIRVPFAFRWTGKLPAGEDYDQPISALDIFATAAALANATVPESHQLDGVNLMPQLLGRTKTPPHEVLYWRRGGGESYAVRQGDQKLTEQIRGKVQVYDLASDIGEKRNLAASDAESLAELTVLKDAWDAQLVEPKWQSPNAGKAKPKPAKPK